MTLRSLEDLHLPELPVPIGSIGDSIRALRDFDHSPTAVDQDQQAAQQHLQTLSEVASVVSQNETLRSDPAHRNSATILSTLVQEVQTGFTFRQEHQLPPAYQQFRKIEQAMDQQQPYSQELTLLSQQPDAAIYVNNLLEQYATHEEVLSRGGFTNLLAYRDMVSDVFVGIGVMHQETLEAKLAKIDELAAKGLASLPLVQAKGEEEFLREQLARLDRARASATITLADSLSSALRLGAARIEIDDETKYGHIEAMNNLSDSGDTKGAVEEAFQFLCAAVDLDPVDIEQNGFDKPALLLQLTKLGDQIELLRIATDTDSYDFRDILLLVKDLRRVKRLKQNDERYELIRQQRRLNNLLNLIPRFERLLELRQSEPGHISFSEQLDNALFEEFRAQFVKAATPPKSTQSPDS